MRKIRDINNNLIFFIDIPLKLNINDISININIATIQVLLWTRTAQYTERKEPIRNKNFFFLPNGIKINPKNDKRNNNFVVISVAEINPSSLSIPIKGILRPIPITRKPFSNTSLITETIATADIDNDFDSEFSQLISKLTSFVPITSNDELLDYYNIQRRKEDFKAIITDNKSNYKIELI